MAAGLTGVNANFILASSPFPGPHTLPKIVRSWWGHSQWEDNWVQSQHHYQQELWEILRRIMITRHALLFPCHGKPRKCVSLRTFDRMSFLSQLRLAMAFFFPLWISKKKKNLPFEYASSVFNKYNRRIMMEDIFDHRTLIGCVRLVWTS